MTIGRIGGNIPPSLPIQAQDSQKKTTEAVLSGQNDIRLGVKEARVVIDPYGNVMDLRLDANA